MTLALRSMVSDLVARAIRDYDELAKGGFLDLYAFPSLSLQRSIRTHQLLIEYKGIHVHDSLPGDLLSMLRLMAPYFVEVDEAAVRAAHHALIRCLAADVHPECYLVTEEQRDIARQLRDIRANIAALDPRCDWDLISVKARRTIAQHLRVSSQAIGSPMDFLAKIVRQEEVERAASAEVVPGKMLSGLLKDRFSVFGSPRKMGPSTSEYRIRVGTQLVVVVFVDLAPRLGGFEQRISLQDIDGDFRLPCFDRLARMGFDSCTIDGLTKENLLAGIESVFTLLSSSLAEARAIDATLATYNRS